MRRKIAHCDRSYSRSCAAGYTRFSGQNSKVLNSLEMTGRAQSHVFLTEDFRCLLDPSTSEALRRMRDAAREKGIDLGVVSGFRDFERQLSIWNAKFRGERLLLDRNSEPVDPGTLDPASRIDTILLWSALPGASRHHWGTDFDVVDLARVSTDDRVRLVSEEYAPGGLFGELSAWLTEHMHTFGFFRPYRIDHGGVQPEAWHLSYAPAATAILEALTVDVLREAIADAPIEGRTELLARLPELHARFVGGIDLP